VKELLSYILKRREGDHLPWAVQVAAAREFNVPLATVEDLALSNNLLPSRYQRNGSMLTVHHQRRLFRATVAVIGCGGLGGFVLEGLARLGVGRLIAIDPDVFVEHNLNRQLLAHPGNLGLPKVQAARERIEQINPAVSVIGVQAAFNLDNGRDLLAEADLVVDALDSVGCRLELETICTVLEVPLVHGAIAGWYGQVCSVFPGENTLHKIYANSEAGKGIEATLGNPSFTPALVASLEVAEVCKILLGQGHPLQDKMLVADLYEMDFALIPW